MPLSTLVISYLFLGGAGAGTLFVLIALDLLTPQAASPAPPAHIIRPAQAARLRAASLVAASPARYIPQPVYRPLFMPGFQAAAAALVLSAICLAFDLGRLDRLLILFTHPTASYLTLGSYALSLAILSSLALAVLWSIPTPHPPRWAIRSLEWLGLLASAAVMLYAGLLFQSIGTGILLGTALLPVLFVLSALSCGLALLFLTANLTSANKAFATTLSRLANLDSLLILAETVALAILIILAFGNSASTGWLASDTTGGLVDGTAAVSTGTPATAATALLQGSYAPTFWAALVACGLILPFILERIQKPPQLPTALMVLVGGFALRWCLLTAGLPAFTPGSG